MGLGGSIMRHRAIGVKASNRWKRESNKAAATASFFAQALVNRKFAYHLPAQRLLEPGIKATHGRTIFNHGFTDKAEFLFCLTAL